mmetsp:Transcript_45318/g.103463  ORF Transcript_45318/g.103463 Transcript_45318/m.103463 type:complete len:383 (-) Transcript_45318:2152-3300(-)
MGGLSEEFPCLAALVNMIHTDLLALARRPDNTGAKLAENFPKDLHVTNTALNRNVRDQPCSTLASHLHEPSLSGFNKTMRARLECHTALHPPRSTTVGAQIPGVAAGAVALRHSDAAHGQGGVKGQMDPGTSSLVPTELQPACQPGCLVVGVIDVGDGTAGTGEGLRRKQGSDCRGFVRLSGTPSCRRVHRWEQLDISHTPAQLERILVCQQQGRLPISSIQQRNALNPISRWHVPLRTPASKSTHSVRTQAPVQPLGLAVVCPLHALVHINREQEVRVGARGGKHEPPVLVQAGHRAEDALAALLRVHAGDGAAADAEDDEGVCLGDGRGVDLEGDRAGAGAGAGGPGEDLQADGVCDPWLEPADGWIDLAEIVHSPRIHW